MTRMNHHIPIFILFLTRINKSVGLAYPSNVPLFQDQVPMRRMVPSKTEGLEIELPDFDELFDRIQDVSPLAKLAINSSKEGQASLKIKDGAFLRGFAAIDEESYKQSNGKPWKMIESDNRKLVHHIDKIENYQNIHWPLLRFRSSLKGPCSGEKFAELIMNVEERKKWDDQISYVEQIYSIYDFEAANIAMGMKYGECSRLGIGYSKNKSNFVVDGREQLTMCGIQDFEDGSSVIWGTEVEQRYDYLFPPSDDGRHTRAKSHLFSATLVPTSQNSFDVEYILQLEVGGKIPPFLTTPILIASVKNMFEYAQVVFQDESLMAPFVSKSNLSNSTKWRKAQDMIGSDKLGILLTP